MKPFVVVSILLVNSWFSLTAGEIESAEEMQTGCYVSTFFFDDFEIDPMDWGGTGFGWCNESTIVGPVSAYSGEYCMGTVCDGNYGYGSLYSLISPRLTLPQISTGEYINLHYSQWYAIRSCSDGPCRALVEISDNGVSWDTLIGPFGLYNEAWSTGGANISTYAGKTVYIKFTLDVREAWSYEVDKGWFVDDVGIYIHTFGVDAGSDATQCKSDSTQLSAVPGCGIWPYTYSWSPTDGLSNPLIQNPLASPDTTTKYMVTVTDDSGQVAIDSVKVIVLMSPDRPALYSPTVCHDSFPSPIYFEWEDMGAIEYHLQVDNNSSFASPEIDVQTNAPNYLDTANSLTDLAQYYWRVRGKDGGCWGRWSDTWIFVPLDATDYDFSSLPEKYELKQNYPNPFNPATRIEFTLPQASVVSIIIYDILGAEVCTLTAKRLLAGPHAVIWNGEDNNGLPVASGIYFYRFQANEFIDVRKMVLLK